MKKLVLDIKHVGERTLEIQVVHMDENLREQEIYSSRNFWIYSQGEPEIRVGHLFIRGRNRNKDNKIASYQFSTSEDRLDYVMKLMDAMDNINSKDEVDFVSGLKG